MKNPILNTIAWITSILLFFSTWFFWPDSIDVGIISESENSGSIIPDYLIKKFRYTSVKAEKREMEMNADTAIFFLEKSQVFSNNPVAYFYNENGEKTTLTGDRSIYWMKDRKLQVSGKVHSLSPDGFAMDGELVDYYLENKFLESKLPVYGITEKKDMKIWSNKANTLIDTKKVFFEGNVRTEHLSPKKELTKIRGDSAILQRQKNEVTYFDNVFIQQPKLDVHCEEASLWYGEENSRKTMKYMLAKRDVQIRETEERFSRSQEAEFIADTNTIILTGFPSVYDGKDTVTGDRLTVFRTTGVIEVTSANAAFAGENKQSTKKNKSTVSGEDLELVIEEPKQE